MSKHIIKILSGQESKFKVDKELIELTFKMETDLKNPSIQNLISSAILVYDTNLFDISPYIVNELVLKILSKNTGDSIIEIQENIKALSINIEKNSEFKTKLHERYLDIEDKNKIHIAKQYTYAIMHIYNSSTDFADFIKDIPSINGTELYEIAITEAEMLEVFQELRGYVNQPLEIATFINLLDSKRTKYFDLAVGGILERPFKMLTPKAKYNNDIISEGFEYNLKDLEYVIEIKMESLDEPVTIKTSLHERFWNNYIHRNSQQNYILKFQGKEIVIEPDNYIRQIGMFVSKYIKLDYLDLKEIKNIKINDKIKNIRKNIIDNLKSKIFLQSEEGLFEITDELDFFLELPKVKNSFNDIKELAYKEFNFNKLEEFNKKFTEINKCSTETISNFHKNIYKIALLIYLFDEKSTKDSINKIINMITEKILNILEEDEYNNDFEIIKHLSIEEESEVYSEVEEILYECK